MNLLVQSGDAAQVAPKKERGTMLRSTALILLMSIAPAYAGTVDTLAKEDAEQARTAAKPSAAAPAVSPEDQRKQADVLFTNGKYEDAKAIYAKIAASFKDDFQFNKRLAYCYFIGAKTDLPKAAQFYDRAYALNPRDREVESNLANALNWTRQYARAIKMYQAILARDQYNRDARLNLARALNYNGQAAQARTAYDEFLQRWPSDRDARMEYGTFLGWSKQYPAALEQYRYVLRSDPTNLQARLGEAQVLLWQGDQEGSLKIYNDVLKQNPNNTDALRGKAFALLWAQHYEEAAPLFAALNRKAPGDREIQDALQQIARWKSEGPKRETDTQMSAAAAAAANRDYPKAIEILQQAMTKSNDPELRLRLALYQMWSSHPDQAIPVLEKLYAERPNDLNVLRQLANAQSQAGKATEAIATYRAYLQRSPDEGVQVDLARLLSWNSRYEEAKDMYKQVLSNNSNNIDALMGMAQVTSWQSEYQQSLAEYDKVLEHQPSNRDALLGKAQTLQWSGDHDKAVALLETMVEKWPQDREIAGALQSVKEAEAQRVASGNSGRAPVDLDSRITMYEEALKQNPNSPITLARLGDLYTQKKDYAKAIVSYQNAISQKPGDTETMISLARVAMWNSEYPLSISLYQSLLAKEPTNREYRLEIAKMLSWSGKKTESIAEYKEILKQNPNDVEVMLGMARVMSWNKQLDESANVYAQILKVEPSNRDAAVERARVLSWNGELSAALRAYDDVLIHAPTDRDARFGKAQALYWGGDPGQARAILEEMKTALPADRDVGITLASVQSTLGRGDLALAALDELDKRFPGDNEVSQMRASIRQDMRPVMTLHFGPTVDSDDIRLYASTANFSWNLTPRVRSYVTTNFNPVRDPDLGWETATEVLFGAATRPASWLRIRGEAGVNTSSGGHNDVIGGGGATIYASRRLSFDFDVSRRFVNWVVEPQRLNISRVESRVGVDLGLDKKTTVHADYYNQQYSNSNANNGGDFTVTRKLVSLERFQMSGGYTYTGFGFTDNINSGFWSPQMFQRHAGFVNIRSPLGKRNVLSFNGTMGANQSHSFGSAVEPYVSGGTVRGGWDFKVSDHLTFTTGYGYYSSAGARLINSVGNGYSAHFGYIDLKYAF